MLVKNEDHCVFTFSDVLSLFFHLKERVMCGMHMDHSGSRLFNGLRPNIVSSLNDLFVLFCNVW